MYNTIQKTIAAWAFNHYIAYYYFDNVNVSQLKVAFEKGEVELENLPIKRDALQHLNLPIEVVSGIVGRLSIKVPLLTLLTDPWLIKITNIMLIVAPKKQTGNVNGNSADDSFATNLGDQSHLDLLQENCNDPNLSDYLENQQLDSDGQVNCVVNSEETKLAEFYSSFSASVSAIVRDIYKNIRLEIESMTILFQDFDHGLVKFSADSLLLHRPKSVRNLFMENVSIHLSASGLTSAAERQDDQLKVKFEKCNLDIHDEASNNMQLILVEDANKSSSTSTSSIPPSSTPTATTSEIKIEGSFDGVSIERLATNQSAESENKPITPGKAKEGIIHSRRSILKCDTLRLEFKLNKNLNDELIRLSEKNLHIKLDLIGMQYIHSQKIYELVTQRLMNLLKFVVKLQNRNQDDASKLSPRRQFNDDKKSIKKKPEISINRLLVINIEDGLLYVLDDTTGSCAIPLLEFSLEDCRIFWISGAHQQNGFIFAKIGCSYYNREVSRWDTLLRPWPFNLSLDLKSASISGNQIRRTQHKQISVNSDELAEFVLSSAFLDLGDVALKRFIDEFLHDKLWPLATSLSPVQRPLSQDFNSIFVLHNETGHRLYFAPLEQTSELYEINVSPKSSPTMGLGGDTILTQSMIHKLSIQTRSSADSRDSPDLNGLARWISVNPGESIPFEYETLPIYRRRVNDLIAQSRVLLVRVEGWKTLLPISIDRTGLFFREACSDRVMNEDTHLMVSIDLEEGSARKIVSIRSPLNLVNLLDVTLEVRFLESNQALYIKPDSHLSVPLPYLYNRMHIRPFNVGVTMSEQALLWDDIQKIFGLESKIQICRPITVTDQKHASYCPSQPYRICVATKRCEPQHDDTMYDVSPYASVPVYSMSFIPPLTIVNLLPCKLQYFIGDINGTLNIGSQQKIYHVDTTKPTEVHFAMNGFPQSKAIYIDPGATGSFHHTLEMFDRLNRSLFLNAKIILASLGEEPAVEVIVYAPFWFINKTKLPIIFKQEGAAMEAAGQFREHEESAMSPLLFSFYDTELEPPWRCSMRLGKAKGTPKWCDGFILDKGSGEKRLCFTPKESDSKINKSLIDINIRRGLGRYSETMIVTYTARYGFDPTTKTPKKSSLPSPQNYKLTSYNHNANLAEKMTVAGLSATVSLFDNHNNKGTSNITVAVPGFKLTLVDNKQEKLLEASVREIVVKCDTKIKEQILDCSVQDIRIENLMLDCEKGVVLDRALQANETINSKPALRLIMDRILGNSLGTTLFRQVQLSMCELVLNIEEKLVLKLVEFISFRNRRKRKNMNNLSHELDRILHPEDDRLSKYYFDLLRIDLSSLKLSVFTSANLTSPLQRLKSYLGLKFFGFEDAQVQLAPYFKMNLSNTLRGVYDSVTRFYKRQILEQAPRIVGQQIQNYLRFHLSDLLSTLYDEVYNKLFN